MTICATETFDEVRRRFGGEALSVSAQAAEAARLLAYLRPEGCHVSTPAEIVDAVASLANEEELAAHRCREGVAVSHASDGWWLLFRYDEPVAEALSTFVARLGDSSC